MQADIEKTTNNKAFLHNLFPQLVSEYVGKCQQMGRLIPTFSGFLPQLFRNSKLNNRLI